MLLALMVVNPSWAPDVGHSWGVSLLLVLVLVPPSLQLLGIVLYHNDNG